jgi:hypothetical protein
MRSLTTDSQTTRMEEELLPQRRNEPSVRKRRREEIYDFV